MRERGTYFIPNPDDETARKKRENTKKRNNYTLGAKKKKVENHRDHNLVDFFLTQTKKNLVLAM